MKKIIIITVSILLFSCNEKVNKIEKEAQSTISNRITLDSNSLKYIEKLKIYKDTFEESLTVVGEVSFDEDHVVRIYPIVSGSIEKINFSLGDYIKRGQLIATILSTDITEYQRDFSVAKSNLDIANKNFERTQKLFRTNFASEKDLQIAENEFKNAKSEFTSKKQILELYGGSSEKTDAVYNIYAPNSGYLVERNVNEGTQIRTDNNTNIFTISDLKSVWIWANVYESDIAKIKIGDKVIAKTISYPDIEFDGQIQKINNILEPESRVIKIRTEIPNEKELLKPEMFATVQIKSQDKINTLAIPTSAIFIENNENFIIKCISEYEFEKCKVVTGKILNDYTEIIEGVTEGESVVIKGALLIANEINNKN